MIESYPNNKNDSIKSKFKKKLKIKKENDFEISKDKLIKVEAINDKESKQNVFQFFGIEANEYNLEQNIKIPIINQKSLNLNNKFLYFNVINKKIIEYQITKEIEIDGDGNCFFRNLSYFFTGTQEYYPFFRKILFLYINKNKEQIAIENPYIEFNNNLIEIENYIPKINTDKNFAGELELKYASILFKINIAVYALNKQDNNNKYYEYINYYNNPDNEFNYDLLILIYNNISKHFYQVTYIKKSQDSNCSNNEKKIDFNLELPNPNNNLNLVYEIQDLIDKYKKLSLNTNKNNFIMTNKNKNIENISLDFDNKYLQGYRYPPLPGKYNSEHYLKYIREYLISKKTSYHNHKFPDFIKKAENIENAKKYFRNIASDYELDDDNNLYIKYYNKKSSLAIVNKTRKKYVNYKLCKVPFVQDLNSFIYNIHKNLLHRNNKDLQKELIKKIFFLRE